MGPRISIVTPSFNSGKYIEDAILSVLGQKYENFEHIIVDGGSKDGTVEILKKYPHLRWVSEPDKGQSDALNKGFRMATGEIVGWLNADEFYLPKAFETIASAWTIHPEATIWYGDAIFSDAKGDFLRYRKSNLFDKQILLYYGPFLATCTTFINKTIIEEDFFLDVAYHYVMDQEYLVRLATAGKEFFYTSKELAVFRWTGENKSLNNIPASFAESLSIRRKYGVTRSHSRRGLRFFYRLYRIKRVILHRLLRLGMLHEFSASIKYKNTNMRWFKDDY